MPRQRKQFPLRIPPELYDAYEAWAADEFRSVNAQIEAVLVEAARRSGRLRRRPQPGSSARSATARDDADASHHDADASHHDADASDD